MKALKKTYICELFKFCFIWGTSTVGAKFQIKELDPYPLLKRSTDLGALVVLSSHQIRYINTSNIFESIKIRSSQGLNSGYFLIISSPSSLL